MEKDNDLLQEKNVMDIVTGSMYSLSFLRNITEAVFDPNLKTLTVGEFYEQWLQMCGIPREVIGITPLSIGSIMGYLYCGILLAKEQWFDLLPNEKINDASPDWGFSSAVYSCPREFNPTIKYAIRRIRNALGHGNIFIQVPKDIQRNRKDKHDFEKKITIKFHDENLRDTGDTFDIEITVFGLAKAIKRFHGIAYEHVTLKQ